MSLKSPIFITGTDTGIGKTWFTLALIQALQNQGLRVAGMKPVASGCDSTPAGLRNEDAVLIQQQAGLKVAYETVNPYAFAPPIAPHIAAQHVGVEIHLSPIFKAAQALQAQADILVVEGVGGWRVPLSEQLSLVDIVKRLDAQVLLVVGLRLGCINHALLTAEVLEQDCCQCVGWVGNQLEPHTAELDNIINTLQQRLSMPFLGHLPYQEVFNVTELADAIFV